MQLVFQLLCTLLLYRAFGTDVSNETCDPQTAEILGGNYTVLQNDSMLKYNCPEGKYPYPSEYRKCRPGRGWEPLDNRAECRDIRCHRPMEFEHGVYQPRKPYYNINEQLSFECYQGYELKGSQIRTCLPNGKWNGTTAICDSRGSHCPNPGIPIGASKAGTRYQIESKVKYHCANGLALFGSSERVCQESGTWSGSEPECRSPFTFDTPKEVASMFVSSLTQAAESSDPDRILSDTEKRKIRIKQGDKMNIYIVLDASQSIGKKEFKNATGVIIKLIEKISSYDITPRYGFITYATKANTIVTTVDEESINPAWVIEKINKVKYADFRKIPGTNIKLGLNAIYEMMILQETDEREKKKLNPPPITNSTHHVIILLTDGMYNMGGSPVSVINQIRRFLDIGTNHRNPREDYLDVYVFGIGSEVSMRTVNELASKKPNERHGFKLKDLEDLKKTIDDMIDESDTFSMCGIAKQHTDVKDNEKSPWHVNIVITHGHRTERCKGSLVSPYYVLTAAHCFTLDDRAEDISVIIGPGPGSHQVKSLHTHPEYNIGKLRNLGIPEFYDYDIALIQLNKKATFSSQARPICLPCTAGATRALRKIPGQTTCKDHEETLLSMGNVPAFFSTICREDRSFKLRRRKVLIKIGEKKLACEADALKAKQYKNVTSVNQVVTDRFLCTGGSDPQVDPNTCKGDSGGSLFVANGLRYFQVGVISWGVFDVCDKRTRPLPCDESIHFVDNAPSYARDFHVNIFKVLPWLREKLAEEDLEFIG